MQNEEIESDADSEFVRADLADLEIDDEEQQQQPNIGGHKVLDWILGQRSTGEQIQKAQIIALKEIGQIKRDFEEKLKKAMEQMKAELMEECQRDMVECKRKMDEKVEVANKQIDQLTHGLEAYQGKMAEAEKQIGQLKRDLMASQQKVAELAATTIKEFKLCNPKMNKWDKTGTEATISADGLIASYKSGNRTNVFAVLSFSPPVSQHGIRVMYYEVKTDNRRHLRIGLSADKQNGKSIGRHAANSFAISPFVDINSCWFSSDKKEFEWPSGAIGPKINEEESSNVFGCGLLQWPDDKWAIFFSANGILLGNHIPICVDLPLYPAIVLWRDQTVEANFGDNPAIPFKYDIVKCPGLDLDSE